MERDLLIEGKKNLIWNYSVKLQVFIASPSKAILFYAAYIICRLLHTSLPLMTQKSAYLAI